MAFTNRLTLEPLSCDVNGDSAVTIADVQSVAGAFGSTAPPAPASLDLWPDGVIDLKDIMRAGDCWTATATGE
jgi:hypothetical protein